MERRKEGSVLSLTGGQRDTYGEIYRGVGVRRRSLAIRFGVEALEEMIERRSQESGLPGCYGYLAGAGFGLKTDSKSPIEVVIDLIR